MSILLQIEIPGKPQGKARLRHRVVRSKANPMGYASGYTPAATIAYEKDIASHARARWRDAPFEGPVLLYVTAYYPIPKSFSRAKRAAALSGDLRPISKPDWDNLGKSCSDALNKIVFKDDAQVADARVQKFYSDNPRMRIVVCDLAKVTSHDSPASACFELSGIPAASGDRAAA